MYLELTNPLFWTQWLLAGGLALQAMESLVARRTFACATVFVVRLVLCGALVFVEPVSSAAVMVHGLLLVTSMGLVARLRGPLCGGSDAMWFQVQVGLLLASLAGAYPVLARVGLGWIAAQSVLSYWLAGVVKLRNASWRSGEAVRQLLASDGPYVIWTPARGLAGRAGVCRALAWVVIGFEVLFPLVLLMPVEGRCVWLTVGLVFHAGNAVVLGLNRFVWAWAATYPALLAL
jgi:hypothetical protein